MRLKLQKMSSSCCDLLTIIKLTMNKYCKLSQCHRVAAQNLSNLQLQVTILLPADMKAPCLTSALLTQQEHPKQTYKHSCFKGRVLEYNGDVLAGKSAPIGAVFTPLVQEEVNLWPAQSGTFSFSPIILPRPLFGFIGEPSLCLLVHLHPCRRTNKLLHQHQSYNSANLKVIHLLKVHKAQWIFFNLLSSQRATLHSNNAKWTQPTTHTNRRHCPRHKHCQGLLAWFAAAAAATLKDCCCVLTIWVLTADYLEPPLTFLTELRFHIFHFFPLNLLNVS